MPTVKARYCQNFSRVSVGKKAEDNEIIIGKTVRFQNNFCPIMNTLRSQCTKLFTSTIISCGNIFE